MNQKAILVGLNKTTKEIHDYEMKELKELCIACNIDVEDIITQNANVINPKTYVHRGKLEEIKIIAETLEVDALVFNDELTASQISNIQKIIDITVYDRTYIILEIFKSRATTKEAILQVDIASLKYMLPRLSGLREGLSRQRGTGGNGAHGRGAGETKLELDRRNINDRISYLNNQLELLKQERALQRKKRKNNNIPVVCLTGYTNSGKSSTLNALMEESTAIKKKVLEKNMLFATLETSSRLVKLNNNHEFIITDTVGFVSKLPHQLVEAFKSTLEEITESDLIIHVIDASNPNYQLQIDTTNEVLKEIGVENIPVLYVFNKIDLLEDYFYIPPQYLYALRISAINNKNIKLLLEMIESVLYKNEAHVLINLPYTKMDILNSLKNNSNVINIEYQNDYILIEAKVSDKMKMEIDEYIQK
ncbi:MAG: GTPase HflX [Bacilli bacterium]